MDEADDDSGAILLNSLAEPAHSGPRNAEELERRRKHMTECVWQPHLGLTEVIRQTGKYWKNCGFTRENKSYFYPEEVLYLAEKDRVYVKDNMAVLEVQQLYEFMLTYIPLPCYLAYVRLKGLEYIVARHISEIRCFGGESDIYDYLSAHPHTTLLDAMVSYRVFAHNPELTRRTIPDTTPTAYVVCMNGTEVPSPRVLLTLLAEARGVPVIFAVLLPSGNVVLEEFNDADMALAWKTASASPVPQILPAPSARAGVGTQDSAAGAVNGSGKQAPAATVQPPTSNRRIVLPDVTVEDVESDDSS